MNMRKTAALLSLPLVGALALSGCGRNDGGAASDGAPDQSQPASVTDATAEGTITMWAMGAEGEALPELVKDFEAENPGVTVQVTPVPWASAFDKLQTAIAGGMGPDVSQVGTTWMPTFADSFQEVPSGFPMDDFYPSAADTGKVDDKQVGVPWYVDTRVIYYRTDIAEKAGWTEGPKTWEELRQMAEDMHQVEGVKFGIRLPASGTDAFMNSLWMPWSNGAELTSEDGSQWTIDTPEMVEAFEYSQSFFADGLADVNADPNPGANTAEFVAGETPIMIEGPFFRGEVENLGGEEIVSQYATAVLPTKKSSTSFMGGSDLAVFKDSNNSASAWKLVEWLSQPEVQVKWFEMTGDLPANEISWDDDVLASDPIFAVFGTQLKDTQSPPTAPTWAQVNSAGDTIVEQINRGSVSVAEGLKSLQQQADAIGME